MITRPERRTNSAAVLFTLTCLITGCGTPPRSYVTDSSVYTSLHLRAAQLASGTEAPLTLQQNLIRYFETKPGDWGTNKTRSDSMLDSLQRSSGYSQAIYSSLATSLKATLKALPVTTGSTTTESALVSSALSDEAPGSSTPASSTPASGTPASGTPGMPFADPYSSYRSSLAEALKKILDDRIDETPSDSPFDSLDRVTDFYTAYTLKFLRLRGDSRATSAIALDTYLSDPQSGDLAYRDMARYLKNASSDGHRLLVLYFQSHVHPGTRPNTMTSLQVKIETPGVKVLRLHPTRNYDVDSTAYAESLSAAMSLSGALTAPLKAADLDLKIDRNAALYSEERRRFLSRIGKVSSFGDASENTYGWNFYPSNIRVTRVGAFASMGHWLFGAPRKYNIKAYLEGGATDCFVIVLVPDTLREIQCSLQSSYATLDPDSGHAGSSEHKVVRIGQPKFAIPLPSFHKGEAVATTLGVAGVIPATPGLAK